MAQRDTGRGVTSIALPSIATLSLGVLYLVYTAGRSCRRVTSRPVARHGPGGQVTRAHSDVYDNLICMVAVGLGRIVVLCYHSSALY